MLWCRCHLATSCSPSVQEEGEENREEVSQPEATPPASSIDSHVDEAVHWQGAFCEANSTHGHCHEPIRYCGRRDVPLLFMPHASLQMRTRALRRGRCLSHVRAMGTTKCVCACVHFALNRARVCCSCLERVLLEFVRSCGLFGWHVRPDAPQRVGTGKAAPSTRSFLSCRDDWFAFVLWNSVRWTHSCAWCMVWKTRPMSSFQALKLRSSTFPAIPTCSSRNVGYLMCTLCCQCCVCSATNV